VSYFFDSLTLISLSDSSLRPKHLPAIAIPQPLSIWYPGIGGLWRVLQALAPVGIAEINHPRHRIPDCFASTQTPSSDRHPPVAPILVSSAFGGFCKPWFPLVLQRLTTVGTGSLLFDLNIFSRLPFPNRSLSDIAGLWRILQALASVGIAEITHR
jgi:hypothetical protein